MPNLVRLQNSVTNGVAERTRAFRRRQKLSNSEACFFFTRSFEFGYCRSDSKTFWRLL